MLSRTHRIPSNLFPAVTRGKNVTTPTMRISIKNDSSLKNPKCAVIISQKKASTAVMRNMLRRKYYRALHTCLNRLPNAYICVFPQKLDITQQEVEKDLLKVFS